MEQWYFEDNPTSDTPWHRVPVWALAVWCSCPAQAADLFPQTWTTALLSCHLTRQHRSLFFIGTKSRATWLLILDSRWRPLTTQKFVERNTFCSQEGHACCKSSTQKAALTLEMSPNVKPHWLRAHRLESHWPRLAVECESLQLPRRPAKGEKTSSSSLVAVRIWLRCSEPSAVWALSLVSAFECKFCELQSRSDAEAQTSNRIEPAWVTWHAGADPGVCEKWHGQGSQRQSRICTSCGKFGTDSICWRRGTLGLLDPVCMWLWYPPGWGRKYKTLQCWLLIWTTVGVGNTKGEVPGSCMGLNPRVVWSYSGKLKLCQRNFDAWCHDALEVVGKIVFLWGGVYISALVPQSTRRPVPGTHLTSSPD